jgi:tetratricopeptide (TPR) repeat protein
MRRLFHPDLLPRLIVPLLLIPLLGISTRPHSIERHLFEGKLAESFSSFASASLNLGKAAEYFYWRGELWEKAGLLALKAGDSQAALLYLDKASGVGSLSPQALIALGDAYFEGGKNQDAIQNWQKALASGADPAEILARLSSAYLDLQDYASTVQVLEELLSIRPDDAALYYQIGTLLAATEPASAPLYLGQAAALDAQLAGPARNIRRSIQTARLSDEPAYVYIAAGRSLAAIDEWVLAVEAFRRARVARPDFSDAWAFLGEACQHTPTGIENNPDCLSYLEEALRLNPDSIPANTFLALYWQRHEQLDLALGYLQKAASLDPSNPAFLAEIGGILSEMGDLPAAQASYQQAIDLAPEDSLYWRLMAEYAIRHRIQMRELALPAAEKAVQLNEKDPQSLMVLGNIYYLLEEYEKAEQYLLETLRLDPDFAPAHLHLGMNYLLQGDVILAAQELEQARALAPGTAIAEKVDRLLLRYFP